jgi:hypothetical protein
MGICKVQIERHLTEPIRINSDTREFKFLKCTFSRESTKKANIRTFMDRTLVFPLIFEEKTRKNSRKKAKNPTY